MTKRDPTNCFYTVIEPDKTKHIMSKDVFSYEYLCGKHSSNALRFYHWNTDGVCEQCLTQYTIERLKSS